MEYIENGLGMVKASTTFYWSNVECGLSAITDIGYSLSSFYRTGALNYSTFYAWNHPLDTP